MKAKMANTNARGRGLAAETARWLAVQTRDPRWDGGFVYAVRSTGIYCRPTCPSRRPRRERVLFFAAPDAAEQHGFRACRRCRPRETSANRSQADVVAKICCHIESCIAAEAEGRLTLSALAARASTSPHQLERWFKKIIGITPRQYTDARRMHHLKNRLKEDNDVTTALYHAGFGSSSRLYERAPAQLGMTPATYRNGGTGMSMGYTIASCPLGKILVAATTRGISALYIGEDDAALRAELGKEYPRAEIHVDRSSLRGWVRTLVEHLRGRAPNMNLPLDVQATGFQRRVWEELQRIPYGSTRTYTEIARAIGRPTAARAVARACATNPVSVVIPCHRVIREDGALAGYRWGLKRKRALLERESAANEQSNFFEWKK
jgi:AraC family transcriptional regulator, regulatory protein of adaptative response / methylated-DNA-[protein]-cysteine methyltransferase